MRTSESKILMRSQSCHPELWYHWKALWVEGPAYAVARVLVGFGSTQALGLRAQVAHWMLAGRLPSVPFYRGLSISQLTT